MKLLLLFFSLTCAVVIDGSITISDCSAPIETVSTPVSTRFTLSAPLVKGTTYCLNATWSASNVMSMSQVTAIWTRRLGGSGSAIRLVPSIRTNTTSHVLSGTQSGTFVAGCAGFGTRETNQYDFGYLPTLSTDTLEGVGIVFQVNC